MNIATLNTKVLQLEAMVATLRGAVTHGFDELDPSCTPNYMWLMADLVADIKSTLDAAVEVAHG